MVDGEHFLWIDWRAKEEERGTTATRQMSHWAMKHTSSEHNKKLLVVLFLFLISFSMPLEQLVRDRKELLTIWYRPWSNSRGEAWMFLSPIGTLQRWDRRCVPDGLSRDDLRHWISLDYGINCCDKRYYHSSSFLIILAVASQYLDETNEPFALRISARLVLGLVKILQLRSGLIYCTTILRRLAYAIYLTWFFFVEKRMLCIYGPEFGVNWHWQQEHPLWICPLLKQGIFLANCTRPQRES